MKKQFDITDVLEMSILERIQFVGDVWDSIAEVPEAIELSEFHKEELECRLNAYRANPEIGSPWGLVKERIRKERD